jgi:hypothetical protein
MDNEKHNFKILLQYYVISIIILVDKNETNDTFVTEPTFCLYKLSAPSNKKFTLFFANFANWLTSNMF